MRFLFHSKSVTIISIYGLLPQLKQMVFVQVRDMSYNTNESDNFSDNRNRKRKRSGNVKTLIVIAASMMVLLSTNRLLKSSWRVWS